MKFKLLDIECFVSFPAIAFLSLAIISDTKGTMLLCILSSLFHEAGHLTAMFVKGAKVKSIRLNLGDVAINAVSTNLSYGNEMFISIAGIAVNFILAIFSFVVFLICKSVFCYNFLVANLVIGVFNLLPVSFLDGGQLLSLFLQKYVSQRIIDRILNILNVVFIVPIGVMGLLVLFNSKYNFSLLFAALYLICTLILKEYKNVS